MKIKELIELDSEMVSETKIHFAIGAKEKFQPLYAFYRNDFKSWQENQHNKNFERAYILSLIYYAKDEWLFAGIYKKIAVQKQEDGRYRYETELLPNGSEMIGKLLVKFTKKFRQSYPYLENYVDELELLAILRERYTVQPFPGYEKVKIEFELLKTIVAQGEQSWQTALSNVKGVYLISDLSNGKHYVGSAYGQNAFWDRWKEYSETGHGGNKELKALIEKHGIEYALSFQFAILETRSMNSEDDEIIRRESFWKEILLSKQFGYNKN